MPLIDDPQNARSRKTRAAIQQAALELLATSGARAVSMAEVANRAHCSRRALYLHFPSRAALLRSLVAYVDETFDLAANQEPMRTAPDARAAIRAFARFVGRYHTRIGPIVLAVSHERYDDRDAAEAWSEAMGRWRAGCEEAVARIVAEEQLHPRFSSPERAVELVWSLLSVDVLDRLVNECGWSPDAYGEILGDLLEHALFR